MATKVKLIADGVITPDQITLTTASTGTNTTAPATTAFVQQEISALVDSSPDALNTLNELAAALGDDANFSTTVTNSISTKLPLAGGTLTGALTVTGDANPALEISRGSANTTNVNLKYNTTLTGQLSAANEKFQISAAGSGTEMEFYVNGAKRLEIDTTGNVGIAKTSLTTWSSGYNALQVGGRGFVGAHSSSDLYLGQNAYFNSGWKYEASVAASLTQHSGGQITHFVAAAGTAGNAITWTTGLHITPTGNVGIGTSSPLTKTTIATTSGNTALTFQQTNNSSTNFLIGCQYNVGNAFEITPSTAAGGSTFNSPALVVDSSGDVLIGQTSQTGYAFAQKLVVGDGDNNDGITIQSGSTHQGNLAFNHSGGTTAHGRISYQHNTNYMAFFTNNSEKMRIESNGDVLIGTTSALRGSEKVGIQGGSADCMVLRTSAAGAVIRKTSFSNGFIFLFETDSASAVGSITSNGSTTAFNTSSDYRLKENVDYTWDATTRLKQLKPARFNFIADADTTVDGFLAHEVSDIVPEAIHGEKDAVDAEGNPEYQGIDQSKLVPLLVKTIQELEARITALES